MITRRPPSCARVNSSENALPYIWRSRSPVFLRPTPCPSRGFCSPLRPGPSSSSSTTRRPRTTCAEIAMLPPSSRGATAYLIEFSIIGWVIRVGTRAFRALSIDENLLPHRTGSQSGRCLPFQIDSGRDAIYQPEGQLSCSVLPSLEDQLCGQKHRTTEAHVHLSWIQSRLVLKFRDASGQRPHAMSDGSGKPEPAGRPCKQVDGIVVTRHPSVSAADIGIRPPAPHPGIFDAARFLRRRAPGAGAPYRSGEETCLLLPHRLTILPEFGVKTELCAGFCILVAFDPRANRQPVTAPQRYNILYPMPDMDQAG